MHRFFWHGWGRLLLAGLGLMIGGFGTGSDGGPGLLNAHAATVPERVALVIGNAAYSGDPLVNTLNDARDVTAKLTDLGFRVIMHTDLGRRALGNAITDFVREVRGSDGVALFYYSGHGLQVAGKNYLVPIDAKIRDALDVSNEALSLDTLLAGLDDRGERAVNLLLLDACRDNPYRQSDRKGLGDKGLARVSAPKGTLILYATSPGETASDNVKGRNGLFTQHLLRTLDLPGLEVKDVFQQTAQDVYRDSRNAQLPWQEGMIFGRFYFRPATDDPNAPDTASMPPSLPAAPLADALAYWKLVENSRDAAAYRAFIERFDDPVLEALAEAKLRELTAPSAPSAPSAPPPAVSPETAALARAGEIPAQILQYALHDLGHYRGQLDGQLGPASRSAIRAFQQSQGFAAIGELGNADKVLLIQTAAQAGHPHSQNALGMMSASGVGVIKDEVAARRWFQAAAVQGNAFAAYNLGLLYRDGQGGIRSLDEARRYFEQAKAGGYPAATVALQGLRSLLR